MNYYRELAFALRVRGLRDPQITSALEDVAAHSRDAGVDPRAEFGEPDAFAANFEQRPSRTVGRRFAGVMTILGIVFAVGSLVAAKVFDLSISLGPLSVPLFGAVVCVLVGLVGGFALDRRLPRGFVTPER